MELSHLDERGQARMVDVGDKEESRRFARATGRIRIRDEVLSKIVSGDIPKGDVLAVARVAGIMAAKRTGDMIPMCHPLPVHSCRVELTVDRKASCIHALAEVGLTGRTGVEMEALGAVSVALLTVYDMVKALDKTMVIEEIVLLRKEGGRSGLYIRGEE